MLIFLFWLTFFVLDQSQALGPGRGQVQAQALTKRKRVMLQLQSHFIGLKRNIQLQTVFFMNNLRAIFVNLSRSVNSRRSDEF